MKSCVIFGGSGFVGTHLAKHVLVTGRFTRVHIADIQPSELIGEQGVTFSLTDVRQPLPIDLIDSKPEWIFNLAAVHREPGHAPYEYYETNLNGARNVCAYADAVGTDNIYFTSSISVYGPTKTATDENSPIRPVTPYGGSKYPAEVIHEIWRANKPERRLLTVRPGVLYGPGDPGNIMRMMKAIHKGYFAYPGSPKIFKSYGYIYGLLDSIDFLLDREERYIVHNYVETPTQPLKNVVADIKKFFRCRALVAPIPMWILMPLSQLVQKVYGFNNPIHPVRVKKAATPTHIIPAKLKELGFKFRYTFLNSLEHWLRVAPGDFEFANIDIISKQILELRRPAETGNKPEKSGKKSEYSESISV